MPVTRKEFLLQGGKAFLLLAAGGPLQRLQALGAGDLPARSRVKMRFATYSDVHYGQPKTDYEGMHNEMISWINAEKAGRGLDFTVINGDLVHDDPAMMPALRRQFDRLQMPWYVTHGNHDMINEAGWQQAFGFPYNYAVVKHDCLMLFLNTADDKGTYIQADLNWVKEQFKQHEKVNNVLVFMHITPFAWTKHGLAHPELAAFFSQQPNLRAVFHGHDHDQDGFKVHEGKHYFFDGHAGGSWGVPYRGYRIVEILKNGDMLFYQHNPAQKVIVNESKL